MKKIRIRLTPTGHYFLGGERGFPYDKNLSRQMSETYFISSLKVPGQSTLFGVLRYLIGVKDEKLRRNAGNLIGEKSYDISNKNNNFGIIKKISPLYMYCDQSTKAQKGYYIRTPFDHKIGKNDTYDPMTVSGEEIEVLNYPDKEIIKKKYPIDYNAKYGISYSFMSIIDKKIVNENDIFISSVEVVSRKKTTSQNNKDGFAKKEYMRLEKGWSFVFFAELDCKEVPEYNKSVIIGKDSSVFTVDIMDTDTLDTREPDVSKLFAGRGSNYHYVQSPVYITGGSKEVIDACSFCIIENENMRKFETIKSRLKPVYDADLIQLISAGSILYSDDIEKLKNTHAEIAGFNTIVDGGNGK